MYGSGEWKDVSAQFSELVIRFSVDDLGHWEYELNRTTLDLSGYLHEHPYVSRFWARCQVTTPKI